MPVYQYKGFDVASGAARKGTVDAESPKAARQKLKTRDKILVSEIKEETSLIRGKSSGGSSGSSLSLKSKKVKDLDLSVMTRQFATLQKAHIPLDETLRALVAQVESPVLRQALSDVKDQISEGKSLGDALSQYPTIFNKLYVNMVRAGESSGALGLVLERLADFVEYQVKIKGEIITAMTYPIVMIVASGSIVAFLFVSVVPKLQKVFVSLKVKLPWYTELLIGVSEMIQKRWFILIALAVVAAFFYRKWFNSPKGRRKYDEIMLKAPIISGVVMRINISRFTKTLSTLLGSGVPIINALEITKNTIANSLIAEVVENAKIAVQEGQSLGASIERAHLFPPLVTHMILTGERTGQLEEMLGHVATAYDAEVERKVEAMISLIEPAMVIFMTVGAGGILAALMVPMLSIMSQLK